MFVNLHEDSISFYFILEQKSEHKNQERMLRKISPFVPDDNLHLHPLEATYATVGGCDLVAEYGFKDGSMQHGFFAPSSTAGRGARKVVFALTTAAEVPPTLHADTVVARVFGVARGTKEFEVWHVSVNKRHAHNDSHGGTRWGVYGIVDATPPTSSKTRWAEAEGERRPVNKRTSESVVRGTPNPYAVMCLYRACTVLGSRSVRQHESMPCAQLFDTQYDHRTHPATLLLYRALHFSRPQGLDYYAWDADTKPSLDASWSRVQFMMRLGIPVVSPHSGGQRRRDDEAAVRLCRCSLSA